MLIGTFFFVSSFLINDVFSIDRVRNCPIGYQPSVADAKKCFHVTPVRCSCSEAKYYCKLGVKNGKAISITTAYENLATLRDNSIQNVKVCDNEYWLGEIDIKTRIAFEEFDEDFKVHHFLSNNKTGRQREDEQQQYLLKLQSNGYQMSTVGPNGKWKMSQCEEQKCFICETAAVDVTTNDMHINYFKTIAQTIEILRQEEEKLRLQQRQHIETMLGKLLLPVPPLHLQLHNSTIIDNTSTTTEINIITTSTISHNAYENTTDDLINE